MRYWIHRTKLVNWRSRYGAESDIGKRLMLHCVSCCWTSLSDNFLSCSLPSIKPNPSFEDIIDRVQFIISHPLFSLLFHSRCRWLSEVVSRGVRHLQNQNAANASDSFGSRAQFFSILLWNYQFASAGLSPGQAGRLLFIARLYLWYHAHLLSFPPDDAWTFVYYFVYLLDNLHWSLMWQRTFHDSSKLTSCFSLTAHPKEKDQWKLFLVNVTELTNIERKKKRDRDTKLFNTTFCTMCFDIVILLLWMYFGFVLLLRLCVTSKFLNAIRNLAPKNGFSVVLGEC